MKVRVSTLHTSLNWRFHLASIFLRLLFPSQAVHMLVTAATDLQKDIVEGGRVSGWDKVQVQPVLYEG